MISSAKTAFHPIASTGERPLEQALARAREGAAVIDRTLRQFGRASIRDYGRELLKPPPSSVQSPEDFIGVVREMAAELFGEETAAMLAADLAANPVALTANHHGVDYFAQSVQGSLIFALLQREQGGGRKTALILPCGNIPLNNITYPQGMMLYGLEEGSIECVPRKIPIFSNKMRHQIVCVSRGYTDEMIDRAAGSVARLHKDSVISLSTRRHIESMLTEDYGDPAIAGLSDYSRQATMLNHRIWRRLHAGCRPLPQLVCLEIEKVAAHLIAMDIQHEERLVSRVLFDKDLRTRVLKALNGHRACWEHDESEFGPTDQALSGLHRGSHFFWGVSCEGVKFAMIISQGEGCGAVMHGVDNKGRQITYPFTPTSVNDLIRRKLLIPSMFSCYLSIGLARGVICLGGYYQAEYLPWMQAGLIRALSAASADREMAEAVAGVPTDRYLSGMQTVMIAREGGLLLPAGPLEMMARQGLTDLDTERMLSMTMEDAHLASLFETIPDIAPGEAAAAAWKERMSRDAFDALRERVVVK